MNNWNVIESMSNAPVSVDIFNMLRDDLLADGAIPTDDECVFIARSFAPIATAECFEISAIWREINGRIEGKITLPKKAIG